MHSTSGTSASGDGQPDRAFGRSDFAGLGVVLAITLAARLIPALLLGAEVSDLSIYRHMALIVLRDQDIYDVRNIFPYTPLSLFIPAVALRLSEWIHQPFHLVMKLFPLLGDLGSASVVFLIGRRRWPARATLLGLAFAVNPVSILITGFHGNIMPLSVFFAFWAYYLLDHPARERTYPLSALALGLGIGLRSWPVLLLPFLLRPGQLRWRQRLIYIVIASLPSVLTLAPYLLVNFAGIQREVFDYKSVPDFGWVGAWRAYYFLQTGSTSLPWAGPWLSSSRFYFLGAYSLLALLAWVGPAWTATAGWIATALLLNYTLAGGMAAQYYTWVIPFLIVYRAYYGVFSLVAAGALITFYLAWHPGILLGRYPPPFAYTKVQMFTWNMGFLVATWAVGAAWVVGFVWQVLRRGLAGRRAAATTAPASGRLRWVTLTTLVLASVVVSALAVEVPFIVRSRPPHDLSATVEWTAAGRGPEPGHFEGPFGLAVHPSGDIYVADIGYRRVLRFKADGTFVSMWKTDDGTPLQLSQPCDVAVDAAGTAYVLDAGAAVIYRLEPEGTLVPEMDLVQHRSSIPRGLAVDNARRRFYIGDTGRGRVLVVGMDGSFIASWGQPGTSFSFLEPWGIAVDRAGNVFVAEPALSRVRKLSPNGTLVAEWRTQGALFDIALDPDDRVFVSSADRGRVWVFDNDGHVLGKVENALAAARVPQARALAAPAPGVVVMASEASLLRFTFPLDGTSQHAVHEGQ